jgi:short-subunit dehydrogenase
MDVNREAATAARRPVAVITGASRGIGAATALELGRKGYSLVLAARSEDSLRAVQRELEAMGAPALIVRTDVRSRADLAALAGTVLEQFGAVDVLLHNSGVLCPGVLVSELTDANVDDIVKTNLLAPIELTRALLPSMIARGRGFIGFVDSVGGHIPLPSAAMYSSTKFGLRGFAAALRREIRPLGIDVCVICPGFIATELTDAVRHAFRGLPVPMASPEKVARIIARTIARPKSEVVVPAYYRLFIWLELNASWFMDFVASQYMKRIMPRYERVLRKGGQ